MQRLLLRLLLLAVFFNTAIGVPLHAAQHMHGHEEPAHACTPALPDAQLATAQHCEADEHANPHTACAWCSSHAQIGMGATPAAMPLPQALATPLVWERGCALALLPPAQRRLPPARAPPLMH